eukprot:6479727-Amphidinium_carterae.1
MILAAGFTEVKELSATFVLLEPMDGSSPRLVGMLCLHVDDGIWSGDGHYYEAAQDKLRQLIQKETKLKEQSGETLKVLGRRLSYDATSGSWAVDCE